MSTLDETKSAPLRAMQIIVASLVSGILTFLVIAVYLREAGLFKVEMPKPVLSYVAIILAPIILALYLIVPSIIASSARRRIAADKSSAGAQYTLNRARERGRLLLVYQTRLIVSTALLEAMAFFLVIAYLMEANPWFVVAAIVFAAALALHFPTPFGIERWLADQEHLLSQDRLALRSR